MENGWSVYTKLNSRGNDDTVETNSERRQTVSRTEEEEEEEEEDRSE
jgi:hypothetical protein